MSKPKVTSYNDLYDKTGSPTNSEQPRAYTYLQAIKDGYHILNKEQIILYKPNCVSKKKSIISA